jgi:hypothetical protein
MPSKRMLRKSRGRRRKKNLLDGSRVYLSGPMDFVASRTDEQKFGCRNRVSEFPNRKRDEARGVRELGVIARFRYNDLKEAAVIAGTNS